MVEDGGPGFGSKPASTFESAGDRLRFTVELRPGETTIVSWKKLLREATSSKINGSSPSVSGPFIEANEQPVPQAQPLHPSMASSSVKQSAGNEANDDQAQAGPNRLNNVIEKIERMYAGNGSSDEEDVVLDDVPDDDEYDTDDSFIDDAELDDYFQVDNSAIKHDGFFVNRGQLERIEPSISTFQQPKKRRLKDTAKGHSGSDDACNPNKHLKIGNNSKIASSSKEKVLSSQLYKEAVTNVHSGDLKFQALTENVREVSLKKKTVDAKFIGDPSGPPNGNIIRQEKYINQQTTGALPLKKHNKKLKGSGEVQDKSIYRSSYISEFTPGKQLDNADENDRSIQRKEKGGLANRFDLNVPATSDSYPATKISATKRKGGSTIRPKSSMLEKAIRELEKIVAESRPPSIEVQDPDNSAQAVKRRLTPEIKQKLAKVARLAQATYGKAPDDLIDRLMRTVGHLMQLRSLKRNLRVMATMGMSAKQEKDDLMQKMKQEVAEMVKLRIPYMNSKLKQQAANSGDFQEAGPEEKEALKRKHRVDGALENKICDLYDLYIERVEEDAGPPIRRLYEELAALWPSGVMDTEGIKHAIYRAKDRRTALAKPMDQEKIKKKTVAAPKAEDGSEREASIKVAPQKASHFIHENNSFPESHDHVSTLSNKPVSGAAPFLDFFANSQNMDKPKQENAKGNSSSNSIDPMLLDLLPKKKKKKKPDTEVAEAQFRQVMGSQAEERYKHHKHVGIPLAKSNIQDAAPSGFENLN